MYVCAHVRTDAAFSCGVVLSTAIANCHSLSFTSFPCSALPNYSYGFKGLLPLVLLETD